MADAKRKVLTVVGARSQYIKAAVVSHALEVALGVEEALVHMGQHFEHNMSQAFFDELNIPEPKVDLGISGGTYAQMTGRMMMVFKQVMFDEWPDVVLLYDGTNTTLSVVLMAVKLHVLIVHVEEGARTRSMTNPEEINRICTDHVATLLFVCAQANLDNLHAEGLANRSCFVGDPTYDAFETYRLVAEKPDLLSIIGGSQLQTLHAFYYLMCHCAKNTADEVALLGVLGVMEELNAPVVYPMHSRNASAVCSLAARHRFDNVLFIDSIGYLESLYLVSDALQVVTDSGGFQREAFFAGVKCTTILELEVWPEMIVGNRNFLAQSCKESILQAMRQPQKNLIQFTNRSGMATLGSEKSKIIARCWKASRT